MLRVELLWNVRGNLGDFFFGKVWLGFKQVLVIVRDQVVNVVKIFIKFLRLDL
jgi:hypothetical protein